MTLPVYEWLQPEDHHQWICPHIKTLIGELAKDGNIVKAVGLVNYRAPEAIFFMSQPINEKAAKAVSEQISTLKLSYNGINRLHAVECAEHYASVCFSEHPA